MLKCTVFEYDIVLFPTVELNWIITREYSNNWKTN